MISYMRPNYLYILKENFGNLMDPILGMLANPISPFMRPTKHLLMLSPIPVPPCIREIDGPTCMKGVNIRDCASKGIPEPVSSTDTITLMTSEDDDNREQACLS